MAKTAEPWTGGVTRVETNVPVDAGRLRILANIAYYKAKDSKETVVYWQERTKPPADWNQQQEARRSGKSAKVAFEDAQDTYRVLAACAGQEIEVEL